MEGESGDEDPLEVLTRKHKKEKKELQAKIQSLKKSATKGDKRKKKEVQEEISKLEIELSKRQEGEIEQLKILTDKGKENSLVESIGNVEIGCEKTGSKITKAQKRRDRKAAKERERERIISEQDEENKTGVRNVETEKIKIELKRRGLMIYEIEADGDCLYNAIDHQLKSTGNTGFGVERLRLETSNHIRENVSDYLPFLCSSKTGETMTEKDFDDYCDGIAKTTNWGGQVELRALSHVVRKPITVIQADGPPLVMGEEYADECEGLVLAYHRHMYKLGEHYNSVQPYADDENSE